MKINDIIQEELKSVLSEGFVFNDEKNVFKFVQNVKNVTFNNYSSFSSEFDTDITESDLWVNWSAGFWLNENGFQNFLIEIEKIRGEFIVEMYNRQTDKEEQSIPKEISEIPWKFVVDGAVLPKDGTLYISALIFNFEDNMCTVTF